MSVKVGQIERLVSHEGVIKSYMGNPLAPLDLDLK